ncbi:hypothetical protein COP2_006481 [Malus domestica]
MEEEVRLSMFQIPADKAPGPDGFTGSFYHEFWDVVGSDIVAMVQAFWISGKMLRKLNHTHLVLIPKVSSPRNMSQLRPISLCNVVHKVIAKILTNRMKNVLPHLISANQSAFMAGRQIQDNILVVHEILHSLNHQQNGEEKCVAMKLDMAKAYDRVEWSFLLEMMSALGFLHEFCKRIKECITTVSYSVLLNGSATGFIQPKRGLRQGDPMSPFLFLICAEGLSAVLRKREEQGYLHGIRVTPDGMQISHLFFADDAVIFCKATEVEVRGILEVLQCYAAASGQIINREKCSLYFGNQCPRQQRRLIESCTNFVGKETFGRYLGLSADFGASKKAVFEGVREALDGRINGWAEQFLSPAGKEVMIKVVAIALPNYAMSCFKLPVNLCKEMESNIANFWWRGSREKNGMHWISWEKMKRRKKVGGLGFRDLLSFNLAYLAKIGWRILTNPLSLLSKILKEKYFPECSFMEAKVGKRSTWGWKGIMQGKKILERGRRWRVGDGSSIRVKYDPWLPRPHTFRVISKHLDMPVMVKDLINPVTGSWMVDLVKGCFEEEESNIILGIPTSLEGCNDRIIWHHTSNGDYTVKTGYGIVMEMQENCELGRKGTRGCSRRDEPDKCWMEIWRLKVPNKMKYFIWRCCTSSLAARGNLHRRRMRVNTTCVLCGDAKETEHHLFFECEFSRVFWFSCPLQLDIKLATRKDFGDCWYSLCNRFRKEKNHELILQECVFIMWRIWKCCNDLLFKGTEANPMESVNVVRSQIMEYRASHDPAKMSAIVGVMGEAVSYAGHPVRWKSPKFGVIKVNCDGAWCASTL